MTNKTETTKHALFKCLAQLKSSPVMIVEMDRLAEFEERLEEHLEDLRQEIEGLYGDVRSAEAAHDALVMKYEALGQAADERFRDLQLAEEANTKLQEIIRITGDEMRAFQQAARTDREDTVRAVAQADALSDQLSETHRIITRQASKIEAQQLAIGDLYMREFEEPKIKGFHPITLIHGIGCMCKKCKSDAACGNPGHASFCRCDL